MNQTIVNIGEQEWTIDRTYGRFVIPACRKPHPFNYMVVKDNKTVVDLGDDRRITYPIKAEEVAADLVQDLGIHGVFIAAGERPTAQELAAAHTRMEEFYRKAVVQGDSLFASNRDMRTNGITDVHRRAALHMGEEREWCYTAAKKVDCPYCAAKLVPGVAICTRCNAILDVDKAEEGGLINEEQADRIRANRVRRTAKRAAKPKPQRGRRTGVSGEGNRSAQGA
jgi:hypothetical protein